MKNIFKTLLLLAIFGIALSTQAQKKPYYTELEEVIEAAYNTLDFEMKSGKLKEWATERQIKGSYTYDITIGDKKSEVLTIRATDRSADGIIKQQNAVKDYIKNMRFPFKLPKEKRYQFQYEFKFD